MCSIYQGIILLKQSLRQSSGKENPSSWNNVDIRDLLKWFENYCEAVGMRISTSKSEDRTTKVKQELSPNAKLSIYQVIYVPTLTYGHELWVMTNRTR